MSVVHIHAPGATAKVRQMAICPDCEEYGPFLCFHTPWYGWDETCLNCGRQWQDGEWMPLDFVRQSRQKSKARALKRWHAMPPYEGVAHWLTFVSARS